MYGIISTVPAPVELYDAAHAAVRERSGTKPDGLLVHVGRAVDGGFEVLEVWESKEHFDRYNRDVVAPVMAELAPGAPAPPPPPEFEVRGLVVPSAGIYH
jgi:hypothetical protein